mmetsp:Transcript_6597/g.9972  ORF Transcript_6597/g.9972 Transcript_6597/m.9972 type:complete len:83 (-) Transcript_6597:262-510(-)
MVVCKIIALIILPEHQHSKMNTSSLSSSEDFTLIYNVNTIAFRLTCSLTPCPSNLKATYHLGNPSPSEMFFLNVDYFCMAFL